MATYFITAIDTGTGKTFVTGTIAKLLLDRGENVITHKLAQTGCEKLSEDIEEHRKMMGMELQRVDKDGITCPYVFKKPASPHYAADLEKTIVDIQKIKDSILLLEKLYDSVLVEGVGGIMVPLTKDYFVGDLLEETGMEIILVSSSKLGSINHTLLTLELIKQRKLTLKALVYNHYPNEDEEIIKSTGDFLKEYCEKYFSKSAFWVLQEKGTFKELNL